MRVFCTPYPGKAGSGYSGITAYYNKRDENGKAEELGQRITAKMFSNHQERILKRPT